MNELTKLSDYVEDSILVLEKDVDMILDAVFRVIEWYEIIP